MANRNIHLIGSLPFDSTQESFDACSTGPLSGLLKRIPDGEPGIRKNWIGWPAKEILPKMAALEVSGQGNMPGIPPFPIYRIKPGVAPEDVKFPALGYADAAIESYRLFKEYRAAGKVGADVRFQVSIPSAFAMAWVYFAPESKRALWAAYERATFAEVDKIAASIPLQELAIQWDCGEVSVYEFPDLQQFFPKDDVVAAIARAVDRVPSPATVGVHICYGDPGGKHPFEPKDTGFLTEIANSVQARVHRPLNWIHIPVPISRDDSAYFEPLKNLKLGSGTEFYLGLLHLSDGVEGAKRRINAARPYVSTFGVATECGLGRRAGDRIRELLTLHADASRHA